VGLGFLVLGSVVLLAASNTGNNGLFLVGSCMAGALIASHFLGAWNVARLDLDLAPPAEVFAQRPSQLHLSVRNPSFLLSRWGLVLTLDQGGEAAAGPVRRTLAQVIFQLQRRRRNKTVMELLMRQRGRRKIRYLHVASLFPLGLFRKGRRYPVEMEILVYPEIYSPSTKQPEQKSRVGELETRKPGRGQELLDLRPYRPGDDPRGIHWKQSARTARLIFKQKESEESRRLSILFDNAVGELKSEADHSRFEGLVSEAATAALDYLESGFEVELRTRDGSLPFASGMRQRRKILETLALIQPSRRESSPLQAIDRGSSHLRLAMEPTEALA
jgi:uncharacterized protein (DUF58 family)